MWLTRQIEFFFFPKRIINSLTRREAKHKLTDKPPNKSQPQGLYNTQMQVLNEWLGRNTNQGKL